MTYYNGNPNHGPTATAPLDKWAHDACLPASEFQLVLINKTPRCRDCQAPMPFPRPAGCPHVAETFQRWPWHWSPIWGAAKLCAYCAGPVEYEARPGVWRATEPAGGARAPYQLAGACQHARP